MYVYQYIYMYVCIIVVKPSQLETATSKSSNPRSLRSRPTRKHHIKQNTTILEENFTYNRKNHTFATFKSSNR